jgi:two-component system, NtrC family, sensor histidine kinase HydH
MDTKFTENASKNLLAVMTTTRNFYIIFLLLIVVSVGLLHNFTPTDKRILHDFYRRISYFPIVVAAILYGIRGGVFLAACTSVAFIPHLRHFYYLGPSVYLSELPEVILYFGAGIVTGAIAGREKQLRIKYQDLSRQLERSYKKLHKQASTLVEAEEQLHATQKLSALGQLSASLAHEVKNPLAAIRGAVEILADDFPPDHPKHEFSEILLKETSRLSATVEEVLRYSKKQQPLLHSPRLESLPKVLERVRILLDNNFKSKNLTLITNLDDKADTILIDGDKMAQVFINLLLNSCESMEENGTVEVKSKQNETHVEIAFRDDGPGIGEEERKKIFTAFYSTKEEGTGLGLAISSRIVESYGGTIRVETPESGTGACFIVSLPKSQKGSV